jgi:hypothetical protein
MHLRICGSCKSAKNNWVRKSQVRKLHIADPQNATFAEGPQI